MLALCHVRQHSGDLMVVHLICLDCRVVIGVQVWFRKVNNRDRRYEVPTLRLES